MPKQAPPARISYPAPIMKKFDVFEDGWIPAEDLDGKDKKLGIREALTNAHRYRRISHKCPELEAGAYVFLSTLIMDIYREEFQDERSVSKIRSLLKEGKFSAERIDSYKKAFVESGRSFDIFDKDAPFMQQSLELFKGKEAGSIAAIDYHMESGTSPIDRTGISENDAVMTPDRAVLNMLKYTLFAIPGGQGYCQNLTGVAPKYYLMRGDTLFSTILFNCWIPDTTDGLGRPSWWDPDAAISDPENQRSYLFYITSPLRKIRLVPPADGEDVIRKAYYMSNGNPAPSRNIVPYAVTIKPKEGEKASAIRAARYEGAEKRDRTDTNCSILAVRSIFSEKLCMPEIFASYNQLTKAKNASVVLYELLNDKSSVKYSEKREFALNADDLRFLAEKKSAKDSEDQEAVKCSLKAELLIIHENAEKKLMDDISKMEKKYKNILGVQRVGSFKEVYFLKVERFYEESDRQFLNITDSFNNETKDVNAAKEEFSKFENKAAENVLRDIAGEVAGSTFEKLELLSAVRKKRRR